MYKQNIDDIKVAVIMLDGCILDLNRFRYNYYRHMCNDNNASITKEQFYNELGSMYSMYNNLPLSKKYNSSSLNQKIEEELYTYLKHKGIYPKEGLFELLDYFRQKNIEVAIMSTHRTKKAVEYLQMTRVYSQVHFIIGSDTKFKPLPSHEMLEAITKQFDVNPHQMLVISPFLSLNKAAAHLESNVIYFKDLIEPTKNEINTSFKVVSSFFDILNCLLFERIYDSNIYSSVLGMSNKMNKEELDAVNEHLKEVYHDDQQILNIVEDTYQYHLSQLTWTHSKSKNTDIKEKHKQNIEEKELLEEIITEYEPLEEVYKKEPEEHISLSLNQQQTLELTSAWSQLMKNEETEIEEPKEESKEEPKKNKAKIILDILENFIYSFAISFLILFNGIIVFLLTSDYPSIYAPLTTIVDYYTSLIEIIFSSLFNVIHTIIPNMPSYDVYSASISFISPDGIVLLNILIFNTFIIFIIRIIVLLIKKK